MTKAETSSNQNSRANIRLPSDGGGQAVFGNGSRRREEADFGAKNNSASLPRRLRLLRLIGLVRALAISCYAASGPSSDPADLTVWPNQASHANGDRWLVEQHDQIRRMNPRLLILNFDNHTPREKLD